MAIFKDKILLVFSALSAVLILASAALIFFNIGNLSAPLILHFDTYRGVDLTGEVSDLWLILIGGAVIVLLNAFLSGVLFYRLRPLSYLLTATNFLIAILLLAAVAVIVSVN